MLFGSIGEAVLQVAVLGPLQVLDDAGDVVPVGGRQVRALLTLLAAEAGRTIPGGVLAGRLWPGAAPADPANALQTLVSRLRTALRAAGLDGVIESHPAGYRLAVPSACVDLLAFEAAVAAGREPGGLDGRRRVHVISHDSIVRVAAVRTRTDRC